jgi:ACS family hexuronate transporter-like MFS transporter
MADPTPTSGSPAGKYRWVVCALLFFSVAVNYIDRLIIGILKKPLSQELGWSDTDYGYIAAGFSFAYAFGYLFGGRLMDRLGVKRGLPLFVLLWSLAAAAHGLVGFIDPAETFSIRFPWFSWAERGLQMLTLTMPMTAAGFMFARIGLGLTEGGNFPGAIKAVAEWFPVQERALATGWFNAGTNVGAILCPIAVPWMYERIGWESTFYITGMLGFVWVAAWWLIYEAPEKHPRVTADELTYIQSGQPVTEETPKSVPWLSLLGYRAVWAYIAASMLAGPAWGFYQFFLPDFLDKRFGMSLQATGWWTGAFYALAAVGGIVGGWLSGALMERGWTLNGARKVSLLICALCVVPVFAAPFASSVLVAVLIVGLAGSAHQGWSANLYTVVSDTMPREAVSSVVGLGGFLCFFTGGFVNAITGIILERTGSYVSVFAYFSGMYLLSLLAIQILVPVIGQRARVIGK